MRRPLLAQIDAARTAAGRDPKDVERTLALRSPLPGKPVRATATASRPRPAPRRAGQPDEYLAGVYRGFAAIGVAEVQLVLDPISVAGVSSLAPALNALDA